MEYTVTFNFRLSEEQMNTLSKLAEQSQSSKADTLRGIIDIMGAEDHVIVPLGRKEREFIEGVCETTGVQPSHAVKMILLSYHTLMSSELWKLIKPIDKILEELNSGDE